MRSVMPDVPWFADGLNFTCTQCGHCCTGAPGFVWVTDDEIAAIAKSRGEPLREFIPLYTRQARGKTTLKERANGDCTFWETACGCTIYKVRPTQCRTWPFWKPLVRSRSDWTEASQGCPGMDHGKLHAAATIAATAADDGLI